MRALGIRVTGDAVFYAIVDKSSEGPILVSNEKIISPKSYDEIESLAFFRERIVSLVGEHKPGIASVRGPEKFGRKGAASLDGRLRIEGVVLEALCSCKVPCGVKAIRAIGAGMESEDPKAYLKQSEVRGIEFPNKNSNSREAILVAIAVLERDS